MMWRLAWGTCLLLLLPVQCHHHQPCCLPLASMLDAVAISSAIQAEAAAAHTLALQLFGQANHTVPAKSRTGRACCFGDVSPHPTSAWPGPLNHLYCPHSGRHAGELLDFAEKPTGQDLEKMSHASNAATPELPFEASMGIYVFNKSVLEELLNDPRADLAQPENHFGHHILPRALREDYRIMSYHFDKYWRVR